MAYQFSAPDRPPQSVSSAILRQRKLHPIAAAVDRRRMMRHPQAMDRKTPVAIPGDLRARLETARLDLLALFRALDRMDLSPAEIPQRLLRQLFELDADYVEALWALDQPAGSLDMRAMLRDTVAALDQLLEACARFRKNLPQRAHPALGQLELSVRNGLDPAEAYNMVPGHGPDIG